MEFQFGLTCRSHDLEYLLQEVPTDGYSAQIKTCTLTCEVQGVATPPNQDAKCDHTYHKGWWVG